MNKSKPDPDGQKAQRGAEKRSNQVSKNQQRRSNGNLNKRRSCLPRDENNVQTRILEPGPNRKKDADKTSHTGSAQKRPERRDDGSNDSGKRNYKSGKVNEKNKWTTRANNLRGGHV